MCLSGATVFLSALCVVIAPTIVEKDLECLYQDELRARHFVGSIVAASPMSTKRWSGP
jgi:hypothetical protein